MIITPSPGIAGHRITRTFGLVRGNTIRARHLGRDITAVFRNLVGGEIREYTKLMAEAREQSIDRMIEAARDLGANAIVNVRFTTSYIMGSASEILVFGDAVVAESESGGEAP
ncbi:MAG: YbjQ family protein [Gemmatimonadota bacterium]|nr:YbjQ family protein [Gemmatimonadota bacterium]